MSTRPPLLADRVRAALDRPDRLEPAWPQFRPDHKRIAEGFKRRLIGAKRYRLDPEVTGAAATLIDGHPDLLAVLLRRGRLPYPALWLEWPMAAMIRAAGQELYHNTPELTGVLLEEIGADGLLIRATPVVFTNLDTLALGPLVVQWHRTEPAPRAPDFDAALSAATKLPVGYLTASLLGSAYAGTINGLKFTGRGYEALDADGQQRWRDQCAALCRHAAWAFAPDALPAYRAALDPTRIDPNTLTLRRQMAEMVTEWAGTWRFIVSALGLLHATTAVRIEAGAASGARLVQGRRVPWLSHHTVRLTAPRQVIVRWHLRELAQAVPRRRHEVAGHWANSRRTGDPACDRSGIAGCEQAAYVAEPSGLEVCQICGHRRWWVRDHERGDAARGYVLKDYRVRPGDLPPP